MPSVNLYKISKNSLINIRTFYEKSKCLRVFVCEKYHIVTIIANDYFTLRADGQLLEKFDKFVCEKYHISIINANDYLDKNLDKVSIVTSKIILFRIFFGLAIL